MLRSFILFFIFLVSWAWAEQDIASDAAPVDDMIFSVETDSGKGVAFLMEGTTGGVWMVSGSTVFQGSRKYEISNVAGAKVPFPDQVLVAADRDLMMFQTDQSSGLPRADHCKFDEALLAFSLCSDQDENFMLKRLYRKLKTLKDTRSEIVKTRSLIGNPCYHIRWSKTMLDEAIKNIDEKIKAINKPIAACKENKETQAKARQDGVALKSGFLLRGTALAIGPVQVEISAPLNRFDRGGPVLNIDHELVAVSSYQMKNSGLPDWVKEGTRFEDTRRFALKLDGVEWILMTRKDYYRETRYIQKIYESLADFVAISQLVRSDYQTEFVVSSDNRDVQTWVKNHNRLADDGFNERRVEKDIAALMRMVTELEEDAGRVHRTTIPFYKEQLTGLAGMYRNVREYLERAVEQM